MNLLEPNVPDLFDFMYVEKDYIQWQILSRSFPKLDGTSNGFSCNFLDLRISQDSKAIELTFSTRICFT